MILVYICILKDIKKKSFYYKKISSKYVENWRPLAYFAIWHVNIALLIVLHHLHSTLKEQLKDISLQKEKKTQKNQERKVDVQV